MSNERRATEGPYTDAVVHRIVDSTYSIPDLIEVIQAAVDQAFIAAQDYHPSGIEVGVYIRPRGNPRPRW